MKAKLEYQNKIARELALREKKEVDLLKQKNKFVDGYFQIRKGRNGTYPKIAKHTNSSKASI